MMLRAFTALFAPAIQHPLRLPFAAFAATTVVSIALSVYLDQLLWLGLPAGILLLWLAIADFNKIFFLMLACIPISIEMELPGGLGTDLPSEPLMWALTVCSIAWFLTHIKRIDTSFLKHPITLALLVHLAWLTVAAILSLDFVVSFKFLLAKGWYVIVFYFLAGRIFQSQNAYRNMLWWFFLPLLLTVCIILIRHAPHGFSFKEVNYVMGPFYRNHVMYACLLAIFIPFVWYGTGWYRRWSFPWWILAGGMLILIVGINFAYTRAAYVALLAAVGIYWIVRLRLMKVALTGVLLVFTLLIGVITYKDNWLEFAPDYQRTVSHTRFDNLLEATTKLEDISIMERVYRWVAASYMIQDRPLTGFGPGNFYFFYKNYTVTSFRTYVSDNPERSGMHNYYLMTTVEQGLPGLVFFVGLCFLAMLYGERIYHQTKIDWRRRMALAALLSFVLIAMLMLMNDFVETDKIGSLFFITLAMLTRLDLQNKTA